MSQTIKLLKNSNFWTSAGVSPSSGARLGAGVLLRLLPPLGRFRFTVPVLIILSAFLGSSLFSDSAYAAYSVSISRASSETVSLGSIKPSSTGTLGTGSDVVTVSSNCSAGYNLYVSAVSGGSTSLSTSGGLDYIPSATTATGSETALAKDTWGIGKDGTTFSKLQSYSEDLSTMSPLYTDSGNKDYTIYYGVNVSTAKTPGTYTGDVLYTVLMNGACLEYTLKFDDNGATTSDLPGQTISFGQAVDLSEYSTTDKISKTGYHLSGWKIKDGDGSLLPTNNNTSLDDGESSELTLIAEWEANTYTIAYDGNGSDSGSTSSQANQAYSSNVTLQTNGFTRANYNFLGWSLNSSATAPSYNANTSYAISAIADAANKSNDNGATITLYAVWKAKTISDITNMQDMNSVICTNSSTGETTTMTDTRDTRTYKIRKLVDGNCWMVQNLALGSGGSITLTSEKSNVSSDITLPASNINNFNAWTGNGGIPKRYATYYMAKGQTASSNTGNPAPEDTTFFNVYAATVGYAYPGYNITGSSPYDVCPKNWRLPTKDDYVNLDTVLNGAYDSKAGTERENVPNSVSAFMNVNGPALVYSGNIGSSGETQVNNIGTLAIYWASTTESTTKAWSLAVFTSGKIQNMNSIYRGEGRAVRCLAKQ